MRPSRPNRPMTRGGGRRGTMVNVRLPRSSREGINITQGSTSQLQSTVYVTQGSSGTSKPISKKEEEEKLRAQLQQEIEMRSRACAHRPYECVLPRLASRDYCARHILSDTTAPYKQCSYTVSGSSRRCTLPAPAPSDTNTVRRDAGLCFEHARAALAARQKSATAAPPQPTTEALLHNLQHYVKAERARTISSASAVSVVSEPNDQEVPGGPHALDPFKQIDAAAVTSAVSAAILDCGSESDSESDEPSYAPGDHEDSSGAEEVPYDEDPLSARRDSLSALVVDTETLSCALEVKQGQEWMGDRVMVISLSKYDIRPPFLCGIKLYAGIYSAEEAVSAACSVLRSLQAAYLRQMQHLRRKLASQRRQYLATLRIQKEEYCSIHEQAKAGNVTPLERRQLAKLKAYAGYHKHLGVHALLQRKLYDKRAKISDGLGGSSRGGPSARCVFAEGGVRCPGATIPAARHCLKHILQDTQQVLFSACGDTRSGVSCTEAVAALPTMALSAVALPTVARACVYHTDPPPYTVFTLKKDESDSDEDSEVPSLAGSDGTKQAGDAMDSVSGSDVPDPTIDTLMSPPYLQT